MTRSFNRRNVPKAAAVAAGAGVTLRVPMAQARAVMDDASRGLETSREFALRKKRVSLNGSERGDVDDGDGFVVLSPHGSPTSSHHWRRVVHRVNGDYRAIAPELEGRIPGRGQHVPQEDHSELSGSRIHDWLRRIAS